jgi:hypothetical protein
MKEYYILSRERSSGQDMLVWWRPNNSGYCQRLDWAGKYTQEQIDSNPTYYNNNNTKAIPCEEVEKQAVLCTPFDSNTETWFVDEEN